MSRALALAALAVAALFVSAAALAAATDTPPGLPTVTVPSVSTPVVTTPVATTPAITTAAITTPVVTVPAATVTPPPITGAPPVNALPKPPPATTGQRAVTITTEPPPAATVKSATGSSSWSGSRSSWSGSSSPTALGAAPAAHRARSRSKASLAVSRFHLSRPATVHVTVWQEAPQCRLFGRFTFQAGRGTNALRLPRRIAQHALVVGRYRLVGLVHARNVIDERVRVVRANGRLRVRKIDAAGGCIPSSEEAILAVPALLRRPGADQRDGGGSSTPASGTRGTSRSASAPAAQSGPHSKVLPQLSASVRHTLIFVLLAIAIALLAVSALPESTVRSHPAAALAQHRAALTSAGLAMIVAAALALLLT